jgi:hypothetical protein
MPVVRPRRARFAGCAEPGGRAVDGRLGATRIRRFPILCREWRSPPGVLL